MDIITGIKNFLQIINDNWTTIIIIIGLCIALYKKISDYLKKTDDEKIEIAKSQIKEIILKLTSDAENNYSEWVSAGSIKRSQVIEEIYLKYPILSKFVDQEKLVKWIDEEIDNALDTLRDVISKNEEATAIETVESTSAVEENTSIQK